MTQQIYTTDDFDNLSWHDCALYGLFIDTDRATRSELVLDIDFIAEWLCGTDRRPRFRVAAATLRFHGVTELDVRLNRRPGNEYQAAVAPPYIYDIKREEVTNQLVFLDRPYYVWTIELENTGGRGHIRFGAVGFTQTLRHDPVDTGELQELSPAQRPPITHS